MLSALLVTVAASRCRELEGQDGLTRCQGESTCSGRNPDAPRGGSNAGGRGGAPFGGSAGTLGGAGEAEGGRGSDPSAPEIRCRILAAADGCDVAGDGPELVVRADVITPATTFLGGELRLDAEGTISCAGCDCGGDADARVATCPGAVVAPAFVNPHDHVAYVHEAPRASGDERYEHRHDWRLGLRGHAAIEYTGGASAAARAAHELRLLLDGVTAVAGGAGHAGLVRNLDMPGLDEGVRVAPAGSETFPLGDSRGTLLESGCAYGAGGATPSEVERFGVFLAHFGEGIDAAAQNELRCALSESLVGETTAIVHAVALDATLARALATRRAMVVWSPRSNLALYGNTAPVTLLRRSGVEIALGSDWLLSGSMNVRRELACAASFSRTYLDGELDAKTLLGMSTASAARAAGAALALGRIAPGYLGDLQIVRRHELDPHEAVVSAAPADVLLVLRAGTPLYGERALIDALAESDCAPLEVCGSEKRVCVAETGLSLDAIVAATTYPLAPCEPPPNEPACVPFRPGEYDGAPNAEDRDGDGVLDRDDRCPRHFDPVRPCDAGAQADADADGVGDVCDACPLDADPACAMPGADDLDGDGVRNEHDVCPLDADPAQADRDRDGIGDRCDGCSVPNPGVTPCPLPIAALRDATHPEHAARHALVRVTEAQVIALRPDTGSARGYHVIDASAPFSGIFAFTAARSPGVGLGERLALRGRLDFYDGRAELVAPVILERAPGTVPEPLLVSEASVADGGALATSHLDLLVRIENVSVASSNPDVPNDYDEVLLGAGLRLDDLLLPELDNDFAPGTRFVSVTGVLGYSFGHVKLWPRAPSDLVLAPSE